MSYAQAISSAFEWLKRPQFAIAVMIVFGALLVLSDLLGRIVLGGIRWIILGFFIFSVCVNLSNGLSLGQCWFNTRRSTQARVAAYRKRLHQLTSDEKSILREYIEGQTRTQYLNVNDGVTAGLQDARIIYRASSVSTGMFRFPYNIVDAAWDYLNQYPDLLASR